MWPRRPDVQLPSTDVKLFPRLTFDGVVGIGSVADAGKTTIAITIATAQIAEVNRFSRLLCTKFVMDSLLSITQLFNPRWIMVLTPVPGYYSG
jgi:hypothetical protein